MASDAARGSLDATRCGRALVAQRQAVCADCARAIAACGAAGDHQRRIRDGVPRDQGARQNRQRDAHRRADSDRELLEAADARAVQRHRALGVQGQGLFARRERALVRAAQHHLGRHAHRGLGRQVPVRLSGGRSPPSTPTRTTATPLPCRIRPGCRCSRLRIIPSTRAVTALRAAAGGHLLATVFGSDAVSFAVGSDTLDGRHARLREVQRCRAREREQPDLRRHSLSLQQRHGHRARSPSGGLRARQLLEAGRRRFPTARAARRGESAVGGGARLGGRREAP